MLDMFFVVEQLRSEHPDHFQTLTRVPATFQKIHYDRLINFMTSFSYYVYCIAKPRAYSLQDDYYYYFFNSEKIPWK